MNYCPALAGALAAMCLSNSPAEAPPAATGDYAVQAYFSSELHPRNAGWFKMPWPESEWRYKLSAQTPLWLTGADPASTLPTINVDPGKTYQSILGMGTSLEETSVYNLARNHTDAQIEDILRTLIDPVHGIGMNLFRLTIGTSDFSDARSVSSGPQGFYSYQDDPKGAFSIENDRKLNIIRVVKLALKVAQETGRPIKFFASAWSPPGWMKDSGSLIGGKLRTDMIPAYAAYLRQFVQAYEAEGIPIYAITTNNEHYFVPSNYPGCSFDSTQEKLLVEALGREFKQAGLTTRIWIVDHNFYCWREAVKTLTGLQKDLGNDDLVDGTAFHHYGGLPSEMSKLHDVFRDKSIQFTEGSTWGCHGMDEIAQIFRNGSSSYVSWVTMTSQSPQDHIRGPYNKPPSLTPPLLVRDDGSGPGWHKIPEYYLYGQFMKFVQPGAVRIASDPGSEETATDVAFKNPDGTLVLVAINQNEWVQDLRFLVAGNQFVATIPAATVATYVLKAGLSLSTHAVAGLPDVGPRPMPPTGSGGVLKEWWMNPAGWDKKGEALIDDPVFSAPPSGSKTLASLSTRDEWKLSSGTRLRGYIHPNVTGPHVFYVSGDSRAELYLSTDQAPENKKLIASCPQWAGGFDWHPQQKSAPILLTAGKTYYFETVQVGGGGNGHTDVAWDIPGIANQKIIAGKFLSPP
jgi:O-glycosyl hydrolase